MHTWAINWHDQTHGTRLVCDESWINFLIHVWCNFLIAMMGQVKLARQFTNWLWNCWRPLYFWNSTLTTHFSVFLILTHVLSLKPLNQFIFIYLVMYSSQPTFPLDKCIFSVQPGHACLVRRIRSPCISEWIKRKGQKRDQPICFHKIFKEFS